MKTKTIFLLLPILFIGTLVSACMSPVLRSEDDMPIPLFSHGYLEINGSEYQTNQITYNLKVKNKGDVGFTISLLPDDTLKDYISSIPIFVPGNSERTMPLTVWVAGQLIWGKVEVQYTCEDGTPTFLSPTFDLTIYGTKTEPPPTSTCSTPKLDGCYAGVQRNYYCQNDQPTYISTCTKSCCESYGGKGSFCTNDRSTCVSLKDLPPGTEGNVALLCAKDNCEDGIEKNIRFLLRYKGWNVTGKEFDKWTEDELKQYDIMLCTDSGRACNLKFNSPIYNAHTNGVPFLEIPDTRSASAAYAFGYIQKNQASSSNNPFNVTSSDYITQGYSGNVNVVDGNSFVAVNNKIFSIGVVDLADAGVKGDSTLFKSKENYGHGRYAFVGWFAKAGITDLTTDGEIILNRTLKWLKYGDVYFGGTNFNQPKIGKIAYVCAKDDCKGKTELPLIKFFRNNGYVVSGKSEKSWNASELTNYDFMVCSDYSRGCKITVGSSVYNAHKLGNKGFLELSTSPNAAYTFTYISKRVSSRQSSIQITNVTNDILFNGLSNPLNVSTKKWSLSGVTLDRLLATDVAHPFVVSRSTSLKQISTIFRSDASSTKGRYAYAGWVVSPDLLTEDGTKLLLRLTCWVKSGNSC